MPAIETNDLRKRFPGGTVALDGLDMTVEEGEVYGFLGPNGAGKTTTINILLGFSAPTGGKARMLGRDVTTDTEELRRQIGVLPEGATPYDRLTGREHVEFAAEAKDVEIETDEILSRVGLSLTDADRPAGEYSKGMAQRLGLAMALVGDPDLLVLDEPSSGLDPSGMTEMRELIRTEADTGTTVFFSSHVLSEVRAVCDRAGILGDGKLRAEDTVVALERRSGAETTITFELESPPDDDLGLGEVPAVVDVTAEKRTLTVKCDDPSAKTTVIRRVDEQAAVANTVSEAPSLEDAFEVHTTDNRNVEEAME